MEERVNANGLTGVLDRVFHLSENKTTVRQESMAGLTTFMAMAYILFVNPSILGAAGMDKGAVFTATALFAILGCFLMGFLANYPMCILRCEYMVTTTVKNFGEGLFNVF